jgi:hypothetical protein
MHKSEKPHCIKKIVNMNKVLSKLTSYYEDAPPIAERLRKKNDMQEREMSVAAYQYATHKS